MLKVIRELGVKVSLLFDKKGAQEANSRIAELSASLKEVSLHVAEAGGALLGLAKIQSGHARALEESSSQLGINVERLQELQFAARVAAGVSGEELNGALQAVSKTLYEARNNTGEAGRSLVRMGVNLDLMKDRSTTADTALLILADRFASMRDGVEKTALANEVFGGSGARLLPLLNKGALGMAKMGQEARGLGLVMGEKMVARGAEFDRTFTKVWLVLKNISFLIGDSILKYLTPVIMEFQKFIVQNQRFIALGIATAMKSLGYYLSIVFKVVSFLAERFQYLVGVLGGVEKVSKYVAIAFGLISGAKMIAGVGVLAQSLRGLLPVFTGLSVSSMLWGAGLLAAVFIIQDLFSDDSIIKEWFGKFKQMFPQLGAFAQDFVDLMVEGVNLIIDGWKNLISWLPAVKDALAPIADLMMSLMNGAEKFAGFLRGGGLGEKLFDVADKVKGFFGGGTEGAMQQASASSQANFAASQAEGVRVGQMMANLTVNVPPGTSTKEATAIVSGGVEDGFAGLLRSTQNQKVGGAAY